MTEILTIAAPGLGDHSYLAHDGTVAVVVDPQRDVDWILSLAERRGLRITHVCETHLHNDYVSGGLDLARRTGADYVMAATEEVAFDRVGVQDGDVFEAGRMRLRVLLTPGHTPTHLSYVLEADDRPPAVFTGGSLLLGSVGRTDLVSQDQTELLSRLQYRTAQRLADDLPDDAEILPTHGFGSFCTSAPGTGDSDGTLETERRVNPALTEGDEDRFVEALVSGLTAHPTYYRHMAFLNRSGPVPVDLSPPAPVDPAELRRRVHAGEWVVDLRTRRAFAAGHLAGTIGIELADPFVTYLGWILPWGTRITLIGDDPGEIAEAQREMTRIGIDRPGGGATGGPGVWASGGEVRSHRVADFGELAAEIDRPQVVVLDVRRDDEVESGAIAGSVRVPLDRLLGDLDQLPEGELWVHCSSGYRASIGASLVDRAGREPVLVDDELGRAEAAGLPLV